MLNPSGLSTTPATIQPADPVRRRAMSRVAQELRFGRRCYGHLAGQIGVAVTDALLAHGYIVPGPDKRFEVTEPGREWFTAFGLDLEALKPTRHGLARRCLDWTERRHHLAGPLGAALFDLFCEEGWLRRSAASRAIEITPIGRAGFKWHLRLDAADLSTQEALASSQIARG